MTPCRRGRATKGAPICFRTVPAKKGSKKHVVEYHLPSGKLIGFLGKRCALSRTKKAAVSFDRPKEATWTAMACHTVVKHSGGRDPQTMDRIYQQAKELPSRGPLPNGS